MSKISTRNQPFATQVHDVPTIIHDTTKIQLVMNGIGSPLDGAFAEHTSSQDTSTCSSRPTWTRPNKRPAWTEAKPSYACEEHQSGHWQDRTDVWMQGAVMLWASDASELPHNLFWACKHADKMGHHKICLACHSTKTFVLAFPVLSQRKRIAMNRRNSPHVSGSERVLFVTWRMVVLKYSSGNKWRKKPNTVCIDGSALTREG
jgi:hypothetical protein